MNDPAWLGVQSKYNMCFVYLKFFPSFVKYLFLYEVLSVACVVGWLNGIHDVSWMRLVLFRRQDYRLKTIKHSSEDWQYLSIGSDNHDSRWKVSLVLSTRPKVVRPSPFSFGYHLIYMFWWEDIFVYWFHLRIGIPMRNAEQGLTILILYIERSR